MGTATAGTSAASEASYAEAKQRLHEAFQDDDIQRAVDIGVTAGLAAQPNGPAKVTTYSYMKYAGAFSYTTSEEGVEEGVKTTGKMYARNEVSEVAADSVVDGSQRAVEMAAEHEVVAKGVDTANKNLAPPSEQAMKDTLGAVMSNGADALTDSSQDDE